MNLVQTFQGPSYWPDIPGGFQNIIKGSSLISQVLMARVLEPLFLVESITHYREMVGWFLFF